MNHQEVLDLAVYIGARFDPTENAISILTPDGHVEGCARGKHIRGWLRSHHKPHKPYLRWLSDHGAACECQFMMNVFPEVLEWELAHTCGWCEAEIPDDVEVFGISAKARDPADIAAWEGSFRPMQLQLRDKTVYSFVVTDDSEAKRQGWDFGFIACSPDCARSLRGALKLETDVIDAVSKD